MVAFQRMDTKRRREEDSDSEDERYMKKSRTWSLQQYHGSVSYPPSSNLPLRASPSPPRAVPGLEALTPAHSEHSEANSPLSIHDEPLTFSSPRHDMDYAMQMDEDEFDVVSSQPPDSPFVATNFRPAKLNPDLFGRDSAVNSTDRMPTPMYPTFRTGGMSGLGYPSSGMAGGMGVGIGFLNNTSSQSAPLMLPPPRKQGNSQGDQDRSRRMPSPISEDEDIPDTPTALTQSQLSRLSVTTHFNPSDCMDTDMAPPVMPPTPRGRKRSGALTGMGRFSMGYRDDCEKCRQRVPGHYSHFLQQ
ncbi:hypothetical protein K458DRAFT_296377 [Lentithecium fluviatile CBS 122367]|uniref:Uncharacterized protein n=1 Tax=Lentithecium fluviatile CBS 122367 TaxID=1168545 RepID=A0A6G1JA84_9PLEO|nr:hypothetical protein K458DRAFT_296377 [Lentithecium fluviatile CBS 122367]